ncbi:integrase [Egibacter rhizosphaerae]|uniref:Integrase n=1 Tax=Egibacter rhizosphaerae TaxID=1670831 RepID=A0A411YBJ6_9ACTN|nr:tyrosine-type recombinase/integrase [Egibacter rhizosphaerae]QBI18542.1 integrase [Egibacter rhizosphaerae]
MSSLLGVRFSGPLESYSSGFADELSRQGYNPVAGLKGQLFLAAHVSRWLADRDLAPAALGSSGVAEEFFADRRAMGYTNYRTVKALGPLLAYLRGLGVVGPAPVAEVTPAEALLERYRAYLTSERGLASATARGYVDAVRSFVAGRVIDGEGDLAGLTAGEVTAFVVATCPGQTQGSARMTVTALRSLLAYLHVAGLLEESVVAAVPSAASWRLSGVPKGLEPGKVARLLASCDRRTRTGRRDFAVLMLLARLGLRAGEVAALELDDIDWRAGELTVRGKGDRHERLPLPNDVGRALVGYLRRGRPTTATGREVFARVRAPLGPMTTRAVTHVVFAAGKRAGLGTVHAHRLRHTAATQLLAAGAGLVEIGQLLRHRSQLSTTIYAKVDTEALRTLARPWPGGVA